MRKGGLDHPIGLIAGIEPIEKGRHLRIQPGGLGRFVMDALTSDGPRDNLHWTVAVIAPRAHLNPPHTTAAGREESRMPGEKAFGVEGLIIFARSVEHHLHDAFDVAIRRFQSSNIHAEAARDGGTNLGGIEDFSLDFTALEHVFGEGLKNCLLPGLEAESFHPAQEATLLVTDHP